MTSRIFLILILILPWPAMSQEFVAARTLSIGTLITASDLLPVDPTLHAESGALELIGLATRVTIYEGRPVKANLLRPPLLVTRNQIVRLKFESGSLQIATVGRALSQGGEGDLIRVMNMDTRSTVTARIEADGTVQAAILP